MSLCEVKQFIWRRNMLRLYEGGNDSGDVDLPQKKSRIFRLFFWGGVTAFYFSGDPGVFGLHPANVGTLR